MKKLIVATLSIFLLVACGPTEKKQQKALVKEYEDTGKKIVKASFEAISAQLRAAIQDGGPANAIVYCNVNAIPLTDSLAKNFNIKISRTSHKLRNPDSAPDALEEYMIELYQDIEKMKKPMEPKAMLAKNGDVRFFAPIFVKPECLNCHGTVGREVTEETYSIIKINYPDDNATGFSEGDFRGIWSINFGSYEVLKEKEVQL